MYGNRISLWLKKRHLSYEWMTHMLFTWCGIATNAPNCRVAISSDTNKKLQTSMLMVMEKYDNLMGEKE